MALASPASTLSEAFWPRTETPAMRAVRTLFLVAAGVAAMAIAAKIKVPFWPVPMTMQTFVVLTVGAAYGGALGAGTMLAYMLVGALGFDIFTNSSAEAFGWDYMTGSTGGYLVGFVLAAFVLGKLAEAGWDRSAPKMAGAMLIGNALIYIPGVLWLGYLYAGSKGWDWTVQVGMTNFLIADALKLALAAALLPLLWRLKR